MQGLHVFLGYRVAWGLGTEELAVCHVGIVECVVIVDRAVKVLTVSRVLSSVVFRALDVEVGNPAKLTVKVTFSADLGVVRHSGAFHLILFVRVKLSLWLQEFKLRLP